MPSPGLASRARNRALTGDAAALVTRIKRWTMLPVAVGFGISNAQHVAQVAEFADAAVIGSAIVELIERSSSRMRRPAQSLDLSRACTCRAAALAHRNDEPLRAHKWIQPLRQRREIMTEAERA